MGEIADLAARKAFRLGSTQMSCPTAISAREESYLNRLRKESRVIVLDGCETDCVAKTLKHAGYGNYVHVRLNDLGLIKGGAPVEEANIDRVAEHVKSIVEDRSTWKKHTFSYHPSKDKCKTK